MKKIINYSIEIGKLDFIEGRDSSVSSVPIKWRNESQH